VVCPICKKSVDDEGPNRPQTYPFCCERCKLIDLGRWLSGKYQIPVDNSPDASDTTDENTPPSPQRRPGRPSSPLN